MTHVATLISAPDRPAVTPSLLAATADRLPRAERPVVLAEGVAADVPFIAEAGTDLRAMATDLAARFGAPVDVVVQPRADRPKRLLIADMDSTMIGQECIDELADELGLKDRIAAITERAMRGEIAFEPALRERVGLLRGLDAGVVGKVIAERIRLTPGGRTLVATMRARGAYTALVSGGFTVFTGPIAAMIGFDENRANVLIEAEGRLAGHVAEPVLGAEAKLSSLRELAARHGLPLTATLAVGDGANDLAMIRAAGLGVAFRAKPKVAAEAHARIEYGDLTALLYLQGYSHDTFIEG